MPAKIVSLKYQDWSELSDQNNILSYIGDYEENFGIHRYNEKYWTSGYVGVSRLLDNQRKTLRLNGRECVFIVSSRFGSNYWHMLEQILCDDEYEDYVSELKKDGKFLYKIFYEQPLIPLSIDGPSNGEILCALSFVTACFSLCHQGLKKSMSYSSGNFIGKIIGHIDIKRNMRLNTAQGRNDRFYCKHISFTQDNVENRILKAALKRCKKILSSNMWDFVEIQKRLSFCSAQLEHVSDVVIKKSDFNNLSTSGLYSNYRPAIRLAQSILSQKYTSYQSDVEEMPRKSIYTIPHVINMETVFEFYVRVMLKRCIQGTEFILDPYSSKLYLENGQGNKPEPLSNVHLISYCIPDAIIRERNSGKVVAVIDAKYKRHEYSNRGDSLQLLAYTLLTGTNKCAFVFPDTVAALKMMRDGYFLKLSTPAFDDVVHYSELLLNTDDEDNIKTLRQFLNNAPR